MRYVTKKRKVKKILPRLWIELYRRIKRRVLNGIQMTDDPYRNFPFIHVSIFFNQQEVWSLVVDNPLLSLFILYMNFLSVRTYSRCGATTWLIRCCFKLKVMLQNANETFCIIQMKVLATLASNAHTYVHVFPLFKERISLSAH